MHASARYRPWLGCRAALWILGLLLLASWKPSSSKGDEVDHSVPAILDCTYDEEWNLFRETLRRNAAHGFPMEDEVFERADRLISKHLVTFLEFHRTKSNEFFHDCDREEPKGMVCLYGMLSALFVHHFYLRMKVAYGVSMETEVEVLGHSTSLARLLLINKNNCLDFFDSSNWPFTLASLVERLDPSEDAAWSTPTSQVSDKDAAAVDAAVAAAAAALRRASLAVEDESPSPRWQSPLLSQPYAGVLPASSPSLSGRRFVVYITGTHVALAKEPAEMLRRFAGPLLGCSFETVLEIVDDQHCDMVGCARDGGSRQEGAGDARRDDARDGRPPLDELPLVGLRELAVPRFRPRWTGLDIEGLPELTREFQQRFADHPLNREVDLFVCSSPVVLCTLVVPFGRPILAYMGEPLLLAVSAEERDEWFASFKALVQDKRNFFASYNPFLSDMIEYQTGLSLPVIRMHGLYTKAVYSPTRANQVLVVKGPNICLDPACLLNRFVWGEDYFNRPQSLDEAERSGDRSRLLFFGLDELGGAPYPVIASFRATIIYPYDVALAIFYELYSMGMPLFIPRIDLLPFYVFRGLHSDSHYHFLSPEFAPDNSTEPPFIPVFGIAQWFSAGRLWSDHTDFARFPHLLRFSSVAQLLAKLAPGGTDWSAVSAAMKQFNEETLVRSAAQWAAGVAGVFSAGGPAG